MHIIIRAEHRRLRLLAWGVAISLSLSLGAISCGDDNTRPAPQVIATVNGQPITEDELVEQLKYGPGPRLLVEMIDERLILAEGRRRHIRPTYQQVELKLSTAVSQVGSLAILEKQLHKRGISLEEFKDRLRLEAMLDEIAAQETSVSEADIKQHYQDNQEQFSYGEQVRGRMILVESRANAEAIAEALQAGGDFAGLAEALSIDPGTADRGGDMGYFERGDYAAEITDIAFKLPLGETSDIFRAPDGYCILRVEDRRPAGVKPLAQVQQEITSRLKQQRQSQTRQEWLQAARQRARLAITDPRLRRAVQPLLEVAPPGYL